MKCVSSVGLVVGALVSGVSAEFLQGNHPVLSNSNPPVRSVQQISGNPMFDIVNGASYVNGELHSDCSATLFNDHLPLDTDIEILALTELAVTVNNLSGVERGEDGTNGGRGPCEDDYILIGGNLLCQNHGQPGTYHVKAGEKIVIHTDGSDDSTVPNGSYFTLDIFCGPTTSTTTSTTKTTSTSTTTKNMIIPPACVKGDFHLWASYLQEATMSFCPAGNPSCPSSSGEVGSDQRYEKIFRGMPMFLDAASRGFSSVDVAFWNFQDKPMSPFGQEGIDMCAYRYFDFQPWGAQTSQQLSEAFEDPYFFGSGKDYMENQLDAMIRAVRFGGYPMTSKDLNVAIMVTHKAFHLNGDYAEAVPYPSPDDPSCASKYSCCDDHDYPSMVQFYDALIEKNVYPIFFVSDGASSKVRLAYEELVDGLKTYSNGTLIGVVRILEGASQDSAGVIADAMAAICEHRAL